jgi:hypothetical protein
VDYTALQIENQILKSTTLTVYIQNTWSTPIDLYAEYKNYTLVASDIHVTLPPTTITAVTLSGDYAVGDDVVLVTKDGMMKRFIAMKERG